jgi:hypothetical protein
MPQQHATSAKRRQISGCDGGSGGAHGTQGNGRNARGLCHEKALGVLLAALLSVHPLGVRYDTLTFGYKQHATTREHSTAALRRQRVGVASAGGIGRPALEGTASGRENSRRQGSQE